MILDILTVLFFVLGFALILWMVLERRGDVLHRVAARKRAREMPSSMSNVADELSRVAHDIEKKRDTNSSREPKANGE
jgi:HAMP domain-containing protein